MKPKPFIPAWLDEVGLSAAEMRVFIHLCRSADNQTGIAWPSYRRMTEITGLGKTTVRRCIESLEDPHKLIAMMGKPFAGSCRYRVLPIVPPEGQKDDANSSATGTNGAAPIVPPEADNSSARGTPIVPPEGQEGNPKKVIQGRQSNSENSPEGIQFAQWFKSSLPESLNLGSNWQRSFADTFDKLVTQKRDPDMIRKICRWARTDSFWQTNFMSPSKLLKRNGDGIQYFDVFAEKMKQPTTGHQKPTATVNTGGRTSTNTEEL